MIHTIQISAAIARRLEEYCRGTCPKEACGLLYGTADSATACITGFKPLANASPYPERHFSFSPEEWISVLYAPDEDSPDRIIGIFHSHPASPAVPSEEDLSLHWNFETYAILSLHEEKPSIRCYRPLPGKVWHEQKVMIRNG